MKYYQTEDKLIQFNPSTNVYRIRNTIATGNKCISKEEFDLLNAIKIKKTKFCELMNIFFRDIKHEWVYENKRFKKLDNFDKNAKSCDFHWVQIPSHKVDGYHFTNLKFVYHWGRVYYIIYGGNYAPKGQLVDIKKLQIVQWVDIKNVAPVFNIETKKVV